AWQSVVRSGNGTASLPGSSPGAVRVLSRRLPGGSRQLTCPTAVVGATAGGVSCHLGTPGFCAHIHKRLPCCHQLGLRRVSVGQQRGRRTDGTHPRGKSAPDADDAPPREMTAADGTGRSDE